MFPSVQYIHENFKRFNKQMFASLLPPLPVAITTAKNYLGCITFKKGVDKLGKPCFCNYHFRFSARYDMPENEWEDILIHEMIHYYIASQGLIDDAPHGSLFKAKMQEINMKYHRNISVSRKSADVVSVIKDEPKVNRPKKKCLRVIGLLRIKDGRVGLKVMPKKIDAVSAFYDYFSKHEQIESVRLFFCSDPFFEQFPRSRKIYAHIVDEKEVMKHLEKASEFKVVNGGIFFVVDESKFQWSYKTDEEQ